MYSESIRRPCKEVEVVGHDKKAPHQIIRARLACLAFNRRGVILKEVGDLNYHKLCKGAFNLNGSNEVVPPDNQSLQQSIILPL